ncbi:MAG: hypothetical protein AAGG00_02735 [Cyanobacteria bacterium P01_H01_bin.150]
MIKNRNDKHITQILNIVEKDDERAFADTLWQQDDVFWLHE